MDSNENQINLASIMKSLEDVPTPTPPPDVPAPTVQMAMYLGEILKAINYHQ